MFLKAKILSTYIQNQMRFFLASLFSKQNLNLIQYHSGGDDYAPNSNCEGLGGTIADNPANGFIFAWKDNTKRIAAPGEKRIYAITSESSEIAAEIHLKNNGDVDITSNGSLNINVTGSVNINANEIKSNGVWKHEGTFIASHIEALDGVSGTFSSSVTIDKGITTKGS